MDANSAPSQNPVDLYELFKIIWNNKWKIGLGTIPFIILGFILAKTLDSTYEADALIEIDPSQNNTFVVMQGGQNIAAQSSNAMTELPIIRSRQVLSAVVKELNLTSYISEEQSLLGRILGKAPPAIHRTDLDVQSSGLEVGSEYEITIDAQGNLSVRGEDGLNLSGKVGELISQDGVNFFINSEQDLNGRTFTLKIFSPERVVSVLQRNIAITEMGDNSGILQLRMKDNDPRQIVSILNATVNEYIHLNYEQSVQQAENGINFINEELPVYRQRLEEAENTLSRYLSSRGALNISDQAQSMISRISEIEGSLAQLAIQEADLKQRYTSRHPTYRALLEQRQALGREKASIESEFNMVPETESNIVRLQRNVEVNQQVYTQLLSRLQEFYIQRNSHVGSARVIDFAQENEKPIGPNKPLILLASAFFGFIVSSLVAMVRCLGNRRIGDRVKLESQAQIPVVAVLPKSRKTETVLKKLAGKVRDKQAQLFTEMDSDSRVDRMKLLRSKLLNDLSRSASGNRSVMLMGVQESGASTMTAWQLAREFSKSQYSTLFLDADLRSAGGTASWVTEGNVQGGLLSYLSGKISYEELISFPYGQKLAVIGKETATNSAAELLMSTQFTQLLNKLRQEFDVVIINGPAVSGRADAIILGQQAGLRELVVESGKTTYEDIGKAKALFIDNGVVIDGIILNNAKG